MSIYPPTVFQLISSLYNKLIEPRIKVYDEPIMIMWTPSSGKWNINDLLPQTDHFVPVFKRNSPLSFDLNIDVDIEIQDDLQSNKDENIFSDVFESEKYISNDSDIVEFNSSVNDNDSESLSSSYTTDNEKNIKKNRIRNNQKWITRLDHIKVLKIQISYCICN